MRFCLTCINSNPTTLVRHTRTPLTTRLSGLPILQHYPFARPLCQQPSAPPPLTSLWELDLYRDCGRRFDSLPACWTNSQPFNRFIPHSHRARLAHNSPPPDLLRQNRPSDSFPTEVIACLSVVSSSFHQHAPRRTRQDHTTPHHTTPGQARLRPTTRLKSETATHLRPRCIPVPARYLGVFSPASFDVNIRPRVGVCA